MHTISETGHTQDVLAAIHALTQTLQAMDAMPDLPREFLDNHPRLDQASPLTHQGSDKPDSEGDDSKESQVSKESKESKENSANSNEVASKKTKKKAKK